MRPFSALLGTKPFEANPLHLGCFVLEVVRLLWESIIELLIHAGVVLVRKVAFIFPLVCL